MTGIKILPGGKGVRRGVLLFGPGGVDDMRPVPYPRTYAYMTNRMFTFE